MTQHDDDIYLIHMLDTARSAVAAIDGITYEAYFSDENLQLALAHRVQIIGEAARHVSMPVQQSIDLPWAEIIGMRHKIVHDYFGIDFDLVWSTATNDLPSLINVLSGIIDHTDSNG